MELKSPLYLKRRQSLGFSLIEVTLSLGILSFCMIAIIGLIPTGLSTLKSSQEEARAASVLNMVSTAIYSTSKSTTAATKYVLPAYLTDQNPITFALGDPPVTYTFQLDEDGSIHQGGKTTPRQTLFLRLTPPQVITEPLRVYASVVWPVKAATDVKTMTVDKLVGREGHVDTMITYALRN